MRLAIHHVHAKISECLSVKESVLAAQQICCSDEILRGGNDRFTVLGSCEVVFDAHQVDGLSTSFLGLWNMKVHFVSVKISIVGTTDTFV